MLGGKHSILLQNWSEPSALCGPIAQDLMCATQACDAASNAILKVQMNLARGPSYLPLALVLQ